LPNVWPWYAAERGRRLRARILFAPLLALIGFAPNSTENANANGETRTLNLFEPHTNESGQFTYMVNGAYDRSVLDKLNWFLRDWRHDEQTQMDPKMFDIVWEVYRESGSSQPIQVLSAYRSPETNAMLRRRSRLVAEHSLHIQGKAMDAHFTDVSVDRIRDIAMHMQDGGVGFYPIGNTPWVHIDSGSVRYWPRMSRDALARLFPDGKTVFIPADGSPMPGYDQAAADIQARGGSVFAANAYAGHSKSLLAMLFGGGEDEAETEEQVVSASPRGRGGGVVNFAAMAPQSSGGEQVAVAQPDPVSKAKRDLPKGETFMGPAPSSANPSKPQLVASAQADTAIDGTDATPTPPGAPMPPPRPTEFSTAITGYISAPTPPSRPVEFASLQAPSSDAFSGSHGNDAINALLMRKLPSVITRGIAGPLPKNALALADSDVPIPPERGALLAKAAALSAPVPVPTPAPPRLPPLERAAKLYAPLPPIGPLKPTLVAAKIDRSDFGAMTAPKTPSATLGAEKPAAPPSPRADALTVALAPTAQVKDTFSTRRTNELPVQAFTPAQAPLSLFNDPESLHGTD
jgi:uncharacterized protein YcbK (DUF882 family)